MDAFLEKFLSLSATFICASQCLRYFHDITTASAYISLIEDASCAFQDYSLITSLRLFAMGLRSAISLLCGTKSCRRNALSLSLYYFVLISPHFVMGMSFHFWYFTTHILIPNSQSFIFAGHQYTDNTLDCWLAVLIHWGQYSAFTTIEMVMYHMPLSSHKIFLSWCLSSK